MKKKLIVLSAFVLTFIFSFCLSDTSAYATEQVSESMDLFAAETPPIDISTYTLTLNTPFYTYTGTAIQPAVTVKNGDSVLPADCYEVLYANNINISTTEKPARLSVKGIGNYTGKISTTFMIRPRKFTNEKITLSQTSYTYDGKAHTPSVSITRGGSKVAASNYTVTYKNNQNSGTAKVIITGKGNYTGTLTKTFLIKPRPVTTLKAIHPTYVYNGNAKKPTVLVKAGSIILKKSEYNIFYRKNIHAGLGTVTVSAKKNSNFTGKATVSFRINPCPLQKKMVSLKKTSFVYNGKAIKPNPVVSRGNVKLSEGSDYVVVYRKSKSVGRATAIIVGKKDYTGKISLTYDIAPAKPNLVNASNTQTDITLTWEQDGSKYISGYEISRRKKGGTWKVIKVVSPKNNGSYTDRNVGDYNDIFSYRVRSYTKVGSKKLWSKYSQTQTCKIQTGIPEITRIMPVSKSSMKLTWNKISDADGYYVLQKVGKNWKRIATIKSTGRTYYTVKGLTYGKAYTFSLQTYRSKGQTTIKGSFNRDGYSAKLAWKIKRSGGYTRYYDASGKLITDVDGIIGKQSSYYLKVNKQMNTLTIYAKDEDGEYTVPVKAFRTSTGGSGTPEGTFKTPAKYRWHTLSHNVMGQWCTRITGSILFHSVWYYSQNNRDLTTVQYNKLGSTASAGCVRVNCEAAKWIYDNCELGTTVTIYNSDNAGPLGKPEKLEDLPSWHTWDPTDPNLQDLCESKGCH